jgi:5-methylcytosine-specific restriction endonuclease McrA
VAMRSEAGASWQSWYKTARWLRLRKRQLSRDPFCVKCLEGGVTVLATVADHVVDHKGDPEIFWRGALQSLCVPCHNSDKQYETHRGFSRAIGKDGWPIDARHPGRVGE